MERVKRHRFTIGNTDRQKRFNLSDRCSRHSLCSGRLALCSDLKQAVIAPSAGQIINIDCRCQISACSRLPANSTRIPFSAQRQVDVPFLLLFHTFSSCSGIPFLEVLPSRSSRAQNRRYRSSDVKASDNYDARTGILVLVVLRSNFEKISIWVYEFLCIRLKTFTASYVILFSRHISETSRVSKSSTDGSLCSNMMLSWRKLIVSAR